jgi:hypothetical protein
MCQYNIPIVKPETAILRCGIWLCEGLHLDEQNFLVSLVEANIMDNGLTEIMNNGFTSRDHKWNQLFGCLLE